MRRFSYPCERAGVVGLARLCHMELGMSKTKTLDVLRMTHSNDNYNWLRYVCDDEGFDG